MLDEGLKVGTEVVITGGQFAGERGRIMERYRGYKTEELSYGVKLLSGPHSHERGTFVAKTHEVDCR